MTVRTQIIQEYPVCPVYPVREVPLVHQVLRLQTTPQHRLQTLLDQMLMAAQTLPQEHQEEVLQTLFDWEANFFEKYQMDSPLDAVREAAAHALLFLRLTHIEQRIIGCEKSLGKKVKWVAFCNEIIAIVTAILPREIDVNAFIAADKIKQLEVRTRLKTAQAVREVMPAIMADFARAEDRVYEIANQAKADQHKKSKETQGVLASLNDERALTITQLHREFDELTENVSQIARQLEGHLHTTQNLGSKIKVEERVLAGALDECEAVIRKA